MMPCPECGTLCPVSDTKRATNHMWRQYRCRCGLSFHTREKVFKRLRTGKSHDPAKKRNKLMAAFLESKYAGKAKIIIEGKINTGTSPIIPKPAQGREWFGQ